MPHAFPPGGRAVVIGATGAIGGALAAALDNDTRFAAVHALSRSGPTPLDLESEESIAAAAAAIAAGPGDVRLVVNATGFLHGDGRLPERSLGELELAYLSRSFAVNAIGPALLMKHFLPLLPRGGKAVFAVLSARVGSIGDNHLGGWYGYRASKAAVNQLVHTAAIEVGRRRGDAICVALHPGTVDSPMSAPFGKAGLDVRAPAVAARELLAVIDALTPADSGGFFDHHGKRIPW